MSAVDGPSAEPPTLPELAALEAPLARWLTRLKARQVELTALGSALSELGWEAARERDLPAMERDLERIVEAFSLMAKAWLELDVEHADLLPDMTAAIHALVRRVDTGVDAADRPQVDQALEFLLGLVSNAQGMHRMLNRMERSLVDVLEDDALRQSRSVIVAARGRRDAELAVLAGWKAVIDEVLARQPGEDSATSHTLFLQEAEAVDASLGVWMAANRHASLALQAFNTVMVSADVDALDEKGEVDRVAWWQRLDADLPPVAHRMMVTATAAMAATVDLDAAMRALVAGAQARGLTGDDGAEAASFLQAIVELGEVHGDVEPGLVPDVTAPEERPGGLSVFEDFTAAAKAFEGQAEVVRKWRAMVERSGLIAD
jgi:hypothetical protein